MNPQKINNESRTGKSKRISFYNYIILGLSTSLKFHLRLNFPQEKHLPRQRVKGVSTFFE